MENKESQFIFGKNPVIETLNSERTINKIYIADGINKNSIKLILTIAKEKGIIVQFVPRKKLDQISNFQTHQGIIAEIASYEYKDLWEILENRENRNSPPFLVMLDGIEDPHNLGSIIRTADLAGVDGIVIPKRRAASLNSTVAKASAGAIEHVSVARVTNLAKTIDELKNKGFWLVGTDASADKSYIEIDYKTSICLVIGSEGKGISRLISEKCDFHAYIPMKGHVNSLNASVAASLMMYEVYKQRGF